MNILKEDILEGGYVWLYCKIDRNGKPKNYRRKDHAVDARLSIENAPHLFSTMPFPEEKIEKIKKVYKKEDTKIEKEPISEVKPIVEDKIEKVIEDKKDIVDKKTKKLSTRKL